MVSWLRVYPFGGRSRGSHDTAITFVCVVIILGLLMLPHEDNGGEQKELVSDRIRTLWTDETYQCLGWRATMNCSPQGRRKPSSDRSCHDPIEAGMSGYCEIHNRTSGEIFQVMLTSCDSMKGKSFTCMEAREFTEFSLLAADPIAIMPNASTTNHNDFENATNGIVMSIYPSVLPNVYAIVRMLRFYGCVLPIELWYEPQQILDVTTNPILHVLEDQFGPLVVKPINEKRATGYMTKPFAVAYSQFDNVLFLDSDNLPTRDPTFLFTTSQYLDNGAVFWPDYWHHKSSPFNVHQRSLLWELVDMPFIDMMEQESGQLLINRQRCSKALQKVLYYALEQHQLLQKYGLVWGDKDLFRLAWLNTSMPFAFVPYPPALGGFTKDEYVESRTIFPAVLHWNSVSFCGIAMLQHDFNGRILFIHRNSVKLTGDPYQFPLVTHAQRSTLNLHNDPFQGHGKDYLVHLFGNTLGQKACYTLLNHGLTQAIDAIDESMAKVEKMAIHFAIEAGSMLQGNQNGIKSQHELWWLRLWEVSTASRTPQPDEITVLYWIVIHLVVGSVAGFTWLRRMRQETYLPTHRKLPNSQDTL